MFENFFTSFSRAKALRHGPGGPLLEGFAEVLYWEGYPEITARRHIRAAEHFMYWVDREKIPVYNLNDSFVECFDKHLDQCKCPGYGRSNRRFLLNGTCLFLKHLREIGKIATPIAKQIAQEPELFTAFCRWMRRQRGTRDSTLYNYSHSILDFLKHLGEDPCKFDADSLRQFVLKRSQQSGWASAKTCTTALRMFIRFLIAEGKCNVGLDAAIPALAHWRLSSLPRYLQPEEVECIISSCDPGSPIGKRDRAILLLLARLALRAGDIVQLRLNDIDWKRAEIRVSGKGRRQTLLPLTQEVGNALVAYLQDGRP